MSTDATSTRTEILTAMFGGAGLTACVGLLTVVVMATVRIERHPSLWWFLGVAFLLSATIWLLQTQTVERYEELKLLASRIGTHGYDRTALLATALCTAVCAILAREWLPIPVLAGIALLSLRILRQEVRAERGIPELYTPPLTGIVEPSTRSGAAGDEGNTEVGYEERVFEWEVEFAADERASLRMPLRISISRLQAFRDKNPYRQGDHRGWPDFKEFVKAGVTAETLEAAQILRRYTDERDWTAFHEVCATLALAQSIPYKLDRESAGIEDYWRYPIETLYDQVGDCEDTSILAACLLLALGHDVVMLLMPHHVAVGVAANKGFPSGEHFVEGLYLYCETTSQGWHVGQIPPDVDPSDIQVVRLG